jgi:hypothetical protein
MLTAGDKDLEERETSEPHSLARDLAGRQFVRRQDVEARRRESLICAGERPSARAAGGLPQPLPLRCKGLGHLAASGARDPFDERFWDSDVRCATALRHFREQHLERVIGPYREFNDFARGVVHTIALGVDEELRHVHRRNPQVNERSLARKRRGAVEARNPLLRHEPSEYRGAILNRGNDSMRLRLICIVPARERADAGGRMASIARGLHVGVEDREGEMVAFEPPLTNGVSCSRVRSARYARPAGLSTAPKTIEADSINSSP